MFGIPVNTDQMNISRKWKFIRMLRFYILLFIFLVSVDICSFVCSSVNVCFYVFWECYRKLFCHFTIFLFCVHVCFCASFSVNVCVYVWFCNCVSVCACELIRSLRNILQHCTYISLVLNKKDSFLLTENGTKYSENSDNS